MLKIGITGGIGSGKTIISRVFLILGIPVFYADEQARLLMNNDELLVAGIKETFGEKSYADNILDRSYISGIVFNDAQKLEKLNALVHPAVFRQFESWAKEQHSPYVLKEAALLFESGSYKELDKTILVTSPGQLKIGRVVKRSGISAGEVRARMDKQISEEQALALADFVIRNDEKNLLIPQVLDLHEQFLSITGS